jgi:YbbR domain-containing protein
MLRILGENLVLKLIALGASFMLWLYVGMERDPMTTKTVKAEIVGINAAPADLVVELNLDPIVVELSGPKRELDRVNDFDVKAQADLASARKGSTQVLIAKIRTPNGLFGIKASSHRSYVTAAITPKVRKRLPVTISFENNPPFGKRYGAPRIKPVAAEVQGKDSDLKRVAKLEVSVDASGGSVRGDLPIRAVDTDGVILDTVLILPQTANVEIDLVEAPASKQVVISPSVTGSVDPSVLVTAITVEPTQVSVSGRPDQLEALTSVHTGEVNIEGLRANMETRVPLQLPSGVRLTDDRTSVTVRIQVREVSKTTPPGSPAGKPSSAGTVKQPQGNQPPVTKDPT